MQFYMAEKLVDESVSKPNTLSSPSTSIIPTTSKLQLLGTISMLFDE